MKRQCGGAREAFVIVHPFWDPTRGRALRGDQARTGRGARGLHWHLRRGRPPEGTGVRASAVPAAPWAIPMNCPT